MDKCFPKEKMVWPEEPQISEKEKLRIWRALFKKEAYKKKWIIIYMKRSWELPFCKGTIGCLWNRGDVITVNVAMVRLPRGYYIVTQKGELYRIIRNI